MPGRQPTAADIPRSIVASITPPPSSHPATNILILLHGLGDTHGPFSTFGARLNLPETCCLAVQAPNPLPFDLPGFHWGDDIQFDSSTGEMEIDTGFEKATRLLTDDLIQSVLIDKCGYRPREIVLYGFGQGGCVALQTALRLSTSVEAELGGVISVGGFVSLSAPLVQPRSRVTEVEDEGQKGSKVIVPTTCKTPVLLCKAAKASAVTDSRTKRLKDTFEFVQVAEWKRTGDAMPSNRDEVLPIMQFFARTLRSVRGVPKGSVELT